MGVFNVSPPITITYAGYVPSGVVNGTDYELAEFYGFRHDGLLLDAKRVVCRGYGSPWMLGYELGGLIGNYSGMAAICEWDLIY